MGFEEEDGEIRYQFVRDSKVSTRTIVCKYKNAATNCILNF